MLRNRRRSLSLVDRNRGKLDLIVVLTTAALIFIGLIAIANATMDPYAVGEGHMRGAAPSTRGPEWTHHWCNCCRANGTAGKRNADGINAEGI